MAQQQKFYSRVIDNSPNDWRAAPVRPTSRKPVAMPSPVRPTRAIPAGGYQRRTFQSQAGRAGEVMNLRDAYRRMAEARKRKKGTKLVEED